MTHSNGAAPARSRQRVVITGMGTVNPLGLDVESYWAGLMEGRSTARMVDAYPTERLGTKFACMVNDFDPMAHLDRKLVNRTARFTQFALVSTRQALADSGLHLEAEDRFRVGVEMGTGCGGFTEMTDGAHQFYSGGRINPLLAPLMISNMAAGQVAIEFGVRGPNSTVITACAAGTHAIGNAARILERGEADVMLAGGTEAGLNPFGIGAFNAIRALSTRNNDPATASRPFDLERDGFVPGEGAAILVLETLEHAQARGADIRAEVIGFAMTNDGFHQVAPDESGEGPARCLRDALADAGISAAEVDYVNAHGTSTPLNDRAETRALKMALGEDARRVAISSTKSMIGHLLGAAGAVEAVATVLTIQRGRIHPTINLHHPDPDCDLDYVPNHPRDTPVRTAISESFGFGGQNAVAVFRKYEE